MVPFSIIIVGEFCVTIYIPDKGKSNTVIITVDPHDDTNPRQATIQMQAGNAFTKFTISQQ